MNQEYKKQLLIRTVQNLVCFCLMVGGATLTFFEHNWSGFLFPIWGLITAAIGGILGLYCIFRRTLFDGNQKKPHPLALLACICWALAALSAITLMTYPSFYGFDLEILFNSMSAIFGWSLAGILLTSIELFHTETIGLKK
jgi:cation transport ATPase